MELTQQAAREDVLQLAQILSASHPDPYRRLGGAVAFHRRVQHLVDAVPEAGLTVGELYVRLRPLAASLGDLHTALWPPKDATPESSAAFPRLWLDMEPTEGQLYVCRVYREDDQLLLGARLLAVGGISLPELCLRVQQMRGCDNVYSTLHLLALALMTSVDLATLLDQDVPGLLEHELHLDLVSPDGSPLHTQMPLVTEAPGPAVEPPTAVMLPELSSIHMGWSFLTPEQSVACLRIDSLLCYREAFEYARSLGIISTLGEQLATAAQLALGEEPPGGVDAQIATVPAVTDLLRDLFAAMRAANTRHLLVDMRRCPGGSSLAALILEYFLYGIDGMVTVNDGYQIPRYSSLYLAEYQSHTPEEQARIECCLENGGYDFSGERAWEERQRTGLTQAAREQRLREIRELAAQMPTFAALLAESEWERAWSPMVWALTSAHTASAGFDVVAQLTLHGAQVVGIPSGQAPTCYIGGLPFTLEHSGLSGMVAHKWSSLFPADPSRVDVFYPDVGLTYADLVRYRLDPNATVRLALEQLHLPSS